MDFTHLTLLVPLPEYILICASLVLVFVSAFAPSSAPQSACHFARSLSLIAYSAAFLSLWLLPDGRIELFSRLFVIDAPGIYMKGLVLIGGFCSIWLVHDEWEGIDRPEFHLLVMLAIVGMFVMISANDLLALYMGLELQSLPLYVIAAMRTNAIKSSEAGLKYFLLGALSSGLFLYGASLIYGFAGSTSYPQIAASLSIGLPADMLIGLTVGMVFVLVGLAFKMSAAPFHMWTPDVYEGAPTPVTAFFAIIPKFVSMAALMAFTYQAFGLMAEQWSQILIALSIASMLIGTMGALMQHNIKRMLAYSSISHVGYMLAGFSTAMPSGASAVMIYMSAYIFMTAGTFAILMSLRREGEPIEKFSDLAGLSASHPQAAAGLMILMFSMAGIPPLAGFFCKWYIFLAVIEAGLIPLALIGVLTSVVGAFYYLRIIRLIYFQEAELPLDEGTPFPNRVIMFVSLAVTVLFFFGISRLAQATSQIFSTLFI